MGFKVTRKDKEEEQIQESEEKKLPYTRYTSLHDIDRYIYDAESIEEFRMDEAISNHPLYHRPTNVRSKLAYSEIMKLCKPTTKYLLPGQIVLFGYAEPKFKEELEYVIVGSTEADLDLGKISDESPVGKALIGKKVGEVAEAILPGGDTAKFRVISIG
jgi:transcription elongation GreA/GreB family factor